MPRLRRLARAVLSMSLLATAVACASRRPTPPAGDYLVEKPATLIPGVGTPVTYPRALLGPEAKSGEVVLEVTVLTSGRVDPATVEVIHFTDSAFVKPVVAAVLTWRFLPYESGPPSGPLKRADQRLRIPVSVPAPREARP